MKKLSTAFMSGILLIPVLVVPAQEPQTAAGKEAIKMFEDRVADYMKVRSQVKENLPKLPKEGTPEQINAYRVSFEKAIRTARTSAKPGDLFVPEIAQHIRKTLRVHFRGQDRAELRKTIFEAENEKTPLRVNYPYPQSQEFTEMPATLLLKLPQLPKELRYRFVGRNMLLVDRENNVIVDYMVDALP